MSMSISRSLSGSRQSSFEHGVEATEEKVLEAAATQVKNDEAEVVRIYGGEVRKLLVEKFFPHPVPTSSYPFLHDSAMKKCPFVGYVHINEEEAHTSSNNVLDDGGPLKNDEGRGGGGHSNQNVEINENQDDKENENKHKKGNEKDTILRNYEPDDESEKFHPHLEKEVHFYNNHIVHLENQDGASFLKKMFGQLVQMIETDVEKFEELPQHPQIEFESKIRAALLLENGSLEKVSDWLDLVTHKIFLEAQLFCAPINTMSAEVKNYRDTLKNTIESVYCLSEQELENCSKKCIQEALSRLNCKAEAEYDANNDIDGKELVQKIFHHKTASIFELYRAQNDQNWNVEKICAEKAKTVAQQKYDSLMKNFVQTTLLSQHNLVKMHHKVVDVVTKIFLDDQTFSGQIPKCEPIWTDVAENLRRQLNQDGLQESLKKNCERFAQLRKLKKTAFSAAQKQVQKAMEEHPDPYKSSEILINFLESVVQKEFDKKIEEVTENLRRTWNNQLTVKLSSMLGQRIAAAAAAAAESKNIGGVNIVIYFSEVGVRIGVQREQGGKFEIIFQNCPDLLHPYIHLSSWLPSSSSLPRHNQNVSHLLYGESAREMRASDEDGFVNLYEILFNVSGSSGSAENFSKFFFYNHAIHKLDFEALVALYFHHVKLLLEINLKRSDFRPILLVVSPMIFMRRKSMLINGLKMAGFDLAQILQSTTAMALTILNQVTTITTTHKKFPFSVLLLHKSGSQFVAATAEIDANDVTMTKVASCRVRRPGSGGGGGGESNLLPPDAAAMLQYLNEVTTTVSKVLVVTEKEDKLCVKNIKSYLSPNLPSTALEVLDEFKGILNGAATLFLTNQTPLSTEGNLKRWNAAICPPNYTQIIPFNLTVSHKTNSVHPFDKIFQKWSQFGQSTTCGYPFKGASSLTIFEENEDHSMQVGQYHVQVVSSGFSKTPAATLTQYVKFLFKLTDYGLVEVKPFLQDNSTMVSMCSELVPTGGGEIEQAKVSLQKLFEFQKLCLNVNNHTPFPAGGDKKIDSSHRQSNVETATASEMSLSPTSAKERLQGLVWDIKTKMETPAGASTNSLILKKIKEHIHASNTLVAKVGSSDMELEMQFEILKKAAARIKI